MLCMVLYFFELISVSMNLCLGWPKDHNFEIYTLEIEDIFLINFFGGPKPLTVDQYLKWKSS